MTSDHEKIFLKSSNESLIEESTSESDILNYKNNNDSNDMSTETRENSLEDIIYDDFDVEDNELSSEISYQVETDENNEKVLKLKIELIIDDNNNRLFTLNLNINKKTYLEMGKDLLKD